MAEIKAKGEHIDCQQNRRYYGSKSKSLCFRFLELITDSPLFTMEDVNAPKDPYKLAYIIFYWLGTGSLLPWNFFIAGNP